MKTKLQNLCMGKIKRKTGVCNVCDELFLPDSVFTHQFNTKLPLITCLHEAKNTHRSVYAVCVLQGTVLCQSCIAKYHVFTYVERASFELLAAVLLGLH